VTVYSIFGQANGPATLQANTSQFNLAMEFEVSTELEVTGVWWLSAATAATLPTDTGIWTITGVGTGTQLLHHSAPSWSGAAGSGWVKDTYDGTVHVLPGTKYLVAVAGGGTGNWFTEDNLAGAFWNSGITNGPLSAPSSAAASSGQDPFFASGLWTFPPNAPANGFNFYVDVEVTTLPMPPTGPATVLFPQMTDSRFTPNTSWRQLGYAMSGGMRWYPA